MSKSVSKTRVACCVRPLRWRRRRDPSSCHRTRLGGGVVALPQSWGELLDLLAEFLELSMVWKRVDRRTRGWGWHAIQSVQIKASASAQKIPHLEAMAVYCGKIQPIGHRPPHYPPTNQIMSIVAAALAPAHRRDPWFRSCWFAIAQSAQSWHSIISSSCASSSSSSYRTLQHTTHVPSWPGWPSRQMGGKVNMRAICVLSVPSRGAAQRTLS